MRPILVLLAVGVTSYSLVDCLRSGRDEVRGLPKPLWVVVILLLFPPIGGVAYLLFGRQPTSSPRSMRGRPRVVAPDDDPDFLRTLEQRRAEQGDGPPAAGPQTPRPEGPREDQDGDDHSDRRAS
jgi:hypothetical protein